MMESDLKVGCTGANFIRYPMQSFWCKAAMVLCPELSLDDEALQTLFKAEASHFTAPIQRCALACPQYECKSFSFLLLNFFFIHCRHQNIGYYKS